MKFFHKKELSIRKFLLFFLSCFLSYNLYPESIIYELANNDQDVSIYGAKSYAYIYKHIVAASGDINGDGVDDLIIGAPYVNGPNETGEVYIIFGNNLVPTVDLASQADVTIYGHNQLGFALTTGDINGDGIDDLIISAIGYSPTIDRVERSIAGGVFIIYGRSEFPKTWDLKAEKADITIYGANNYDGLGSAVVVGKINNDHIDDLLIGGASVSRPPLKYSYHGAVYLIYGKKDFPPEYVIDLNKGVQDITMYGKETNDEAGNILACGDINGDGKDDLIVGAPGADSFGTRNHSGEVYIIYGQNNLSGTYDSIEDMANVKICGAANYSALRSLVSGDINNDGIDDLLISYPLCVVYGSNNLNNLIDLNTTTDYPHQDVSIKGVDPSDDVGSDVVFADFDGDNRNDLLIGVSYANGKDNEILLAGESYLLYGKNWANFSGEISMNDLNPTIIYGDDYLDHLGTKVASGDFNADGYEDLVLVAPYGDGHKNTRSDCGDIYIFYGFAPLELPSIIIEQNREEIETYRITLSLSVGGDPTEMFISGDIADSFKDTWIPCLTSKEATLTGSGGTKTVTAKFRNALGRESETCSDTIALSLTKSKLEAETNYFNPAKGEKALFNYQIDHASRLRIKIYTIAHELVRTLLDEDRPAEIGRLEWDGRNNSGRIVASGIYLLHLEAGSFVKTEKIVIEK